MANYPSRAQVEASIRSEAIARGIDPDVAVAVAKSEGLKADPAEGWQSNIGKKQGNREQSYGPFQLYMGGGLGNDFQKQTGLDPRDWSTWQAQVQFSLDHAAKNGWSKFHGAADTGISKWSGLSGAQPRGVSATPTATAAASPQAQAQAASYDPTSLQLGFMPGLAAQNTQPAKPATPFEGAVKTAQVPQWAPADRPFPETQMAALDPDRKGINTVLTADGKMRAIPEPNAGMQAQWEAARINGMAAMAGKLASENEARAAQSSLNMDNVRADETSRQNKGIASPNRSDVASLPDDLGAAKDIAVNKSMGPIFDLVGASKMTRQSAANSMSGLLQGPYQQMAAHYEMMTGKPMPPINDAVAKDGTSREKDTKGSMHFHGKAVDISTKGLTNFEKMALDEAAKVAGFGGLGFGPTILHADLGAKRGWGYGNAAFGGVPVSDMKRAAQSGTSMLPDNISVPGAPIPTQAPRGQTDGGRLGFTSPTSAVSAPAQAYGGGNSAMTDAYQQYGQTRDYARSTPMGLDAELDAARMGGVSTSYSKPSGSINHASIGRALQGPLGGVNYATGQIGDNKLMGAYGKDPSFAAAKPNANMSLASQYASYGRGKTDPLGVTANYALNQALDEAVSSTTARPAPPSLSSVPQARPQTQMSEAEKAKVRADKFLAENDLLGVPGKIAAQSLGQRIGGLLGNANISQALGGLGGLIGGAGAPIGSNYSGGWTPAAGGNQVSKDAIGVGIGGEKLSGVQNQYGATSMLGEGGSRTYGGPGGSSGK